MKPTRAWQGTLLILASAGMFGAMAIFAKFAYAAGATVATTLFLRFFIASTIIWTGIAVTGAVRFDLPRRVWAACVLLGGLGYTAQSLLFFTALRYISASLAALLLYVYPLTVTLLSAAFLGERIDGRKGLALGAAAVGLLLVLGRNLGPVSGTGIVLALLAAGVFSAYIIISRLTLRHVSPVAASAVIMPAACVAFALYGGLGGQIRFELPVRAYAAIGGMALVSTVLAIVAFFAGLKRVGASRTAILSTFEPIVTVLLGAALLGERLAPGQLAGGAFILSSVFLLYGSTERADGAATQEGAAPRANAGRL